MTPWLLPVHMFFPRDSSRIPSFCYPFQKNRHSLNSIICSSLHREVRGSMCGRCTNGTGPSVNSAGSQCVKCGAINILYYILLQYLPATITFLVILLFRINVTSAPMAHYVLFCNALVVFFQTPTCFFITQSVPDAPYSYILKAFLTLNSIWSFDLLYFVSPPLCLSPHIEEINIYYIHMLATLYPFLLLLLAYVHAWGSSYMHVPTVPMYSPRHIYLMIFSTCVLLFIVLPPILVLIVFPTRLSNKLQTYFSPRLNLALFTFVDTFQGGFKDGTNGTRDSDAVCLY